MYHEALAIVLHTYTYVVLSSRYYIYSVAGLVMYMEVLIVSKHHQCARFKGLKGEKTILSRDLFKINSVVHLLCTYIFSSSMWLYLQNVHHYLSSPTTLAI